MPARVRWIPLLAFALVLAGAIFFFAFANSARTTWNAFARQRASILSHAKAPGEATPVDLPADAPVIDLGLFRFRAASEPIALRRHGMGVAVTLPDATVVVTPVDTSRSGYIDFYPTEAEQASAYAYAASTRFSGAVEQLGVLSRLGREDWRADDEPKRAAWRTMLASAIKRAERFGSWSTLRTTNAKAIIGEPGPGRSSISGMIWAPDETMAIEFTVLGDDPEQARQVAIATASTMTFDAQIDPERWRGIIGEALISHPEFEPPPARLGPPAPAAPTQSPSPR